MWKVAALRGSVRFRVHVFGRNSVDLKWQFQEIGRRRARGPDRVCPMTTPRRCWRPSRARTTGYAGAAATAVVLALLTQRGPVDPDGGLPLLVVSAVLLALVGFDLWFADVLCADGDGLVLSRGPGRSERVGWDEIDRIEATSTTSRAVLRLSSLEIDLGGRLVVLSRHRLGADPAGVADELRRFRPNG